MKKKNIVLLFLSVVMVLFMVGCNTRSTALTAPTDESKVKLQFEARGTYNMPGFGEEFFIYRFGGVNSNIVVYQICDDIYLVGEDAGKTGTSYVDVGIKNSQFIGLSNQYLLFITEDGLIAASVTKKENVPVGESALQKYFYNDLSDEEKNSFIYPIQYEKVLQQ